MKILIISIVVLAMLASQPHSGTVVRETALPSGYKLPDQMYEFIEEYDSLLRVTISEQDRRGRSPVLLHNNCTEKRGYVVIGDDNYSLEIEDIEAGVIDWKGYSKYIVRTRDGIVFEQLEEPGPSTVWAYFKYKNSWVLETRTLLVVDGVRLDEIEGATKAFNYRIINDTPVYFIEKDNLVNIRVGSELLDNKYDSVLHHMCCMFDIMNPGCTGDKLMFYAYRDSIPYYVELLVDPPN
jgi:hypothetical protein